MFWRLLPIFLIAGTLANPIVVPEDADGSGIVVAVLDTGIDFEHPDLAGRVIERVYVKYAADGSTVVIPGAVPLTSGHGTHVAGIVGGTGIHSQGKYTGIATGVNFVDVQFLDAASIDASYPLDIPVDHAVAALDWIAQNKERLGISIVQNSWGKAWINGLSCEDHQVSKALLAADDEHLLWVFAAGNNGPSADINVPACLPDVLTVAAVNRDGNVAGFSSRGPTVDGVEKPDIAAMGVEVISTEPMTFCTPNVCNPDGYGTRSGTSMAAPHITGIAALMRQANPDLTGAEVKEQIIAAAGINWTADVGYGIPTLERASPEQGQVVQPETRPQDTSNNTPANSPTIVGLLIVGVALTLRRR